MSDQLAVKIALISLAISVLSGAAGYWASQRPAPTVQYVLQAPPRADDRPVPQFDSGDTRFVIDPDASDDQSRNRSCDPANDDCDEGPDDPAEQLIHT